MNSRSFPIDDSYPMVTPLPVYQRGLEVLSEQWSQTESLKDEEPGSAKFLEYFFWRKNMVIWTCCTIESFVNLEGVSWMGEEFYKKAIERQRIANKIRLIYTIKYQELLKPDDSTLKEVESLFELRNQFVHPKTRGHSENGSKPNQDVDFLSEWNSRRLDTLVKSVGSLIGIADE